MGCLLVVYRLSISSLSIVNWLSIQGFFPLLWMPIYWLRICFLLGVLRLSFDCLSIYTFCCIVSSLSAVVVYGDLGNDGWCRWNPRHCPCESFKEKDLKHFCVTRLKTWFLKEEISKSSFAVAVSDDRDKHGIGHGSNASAFPDTKTSNEFGMHHLSRSLRGK